MQPDHNSQNNKEQTSRRSFIKRIGNAVFSVTVVGWIAMSPKIAYACGEGVSDSNCGSNWFGGSSDANCGIGEDPDNNCGTWNSSSNDGNCGNPSSGGVSTGGPNGTDQDEACTTSVVDSNCSINQVPNNGTGADVDESCGNVYMNPDESCGDCDDNHQSDEHCGKPMAGGKDPDDLCGHQHYTEIFGESQDGVCSTTESDAGCGAHTTAKCPNSA
jgi:hypothetical protein